MPATHGCVSALTAGTLVIVTGANPRPGVLAGDRAWLTGWGETVHGDTADIRMDKDSTAILDHYDNPYPGDEAECLLPDIPLSRLQGR